MTNGIAAIPAGYRYKYLTEVPGVVGETPTVGQPSFSPSITSQTAAFELSITSATSAVTFYYTLDGSTPTISSLLYDSGNKPTIPLGTTTVKALGVKAEHNNSPVRTVTYEVVADSSSAVIPTFNLNFVP